MRSVPPKIVLISRWPYKRDALSSSKTQQTFVTFNSRDRRISDTSPLRERRLIHKSGDALSSVNLNLINVKRENFGFEICCQQNNSAFRNRLLRAQMAEKKRRWGSCIAEEVGRSASRLEVGPVPKNRNCEPQFLQRNRFFCRKNTQWMGIAIL